MTIELHQLFQKAVDLKASDLLLTVNSPPTFRIHSELRLMKNEPLIAEDLNKALRTVMSPDEICEFEENGEVDICIEAGGRRFRGNIYKQRNNPAVAFRLIPAIIPNLEELGLPLVLGQMTLMPRGLILITGPTGSGKSTTLAALVSHINSQRRCHVITIEDPIEFVFTNEKSIIDQREIGRDTRNFETALRHALRETPDVLMIGEMRDIETIAAALTAAETGHLVMATLHTSTATQSIDRIIDVFPPHQQYQIRLQLSFSLLAIFSQKLMPTADGTGLVLASEYLRNIQAIANNIREGKTQLLYGILETSSRYAMQTMDNSIKHLFEKGVITKKEAIRNMEHPKLLENINMDAPRNLR